MFKETKNEIIHYFYKFKNTSKTNKTVLKCLYNHIFINLQIFNNKLFYLYNTAKTVV